MEPVLYLYDESQKLRGVFIDAATWLQVEPLLRPHLPSAKPRPRPEVAEPLDGWKTLTEFWDFAYPVNTQVACGICGVATEDWQADEPRKFRLKAANLGGLVTFQCLHCQAKVIKRHFKDKITTETKPFIAERG